MTQNPNLAALSAAGVSVWLDDLSRERLQTRTPDAPASPCPRSHASMSTASTPLVWAAEAPVSRTSRFA